MHIMTDSSDINDVHNGDEPPTNPNVKSKAMGSDLAHKDVSVLGRRGSLESSNDVRLEEDRPTEEDAQDADEGAIESSEDEEAKSSDEEDASTPDRKRGRRRSRADKGSDISNVGSEISDDDPYASLYGQNKSTRLAKSALAAAEDDRTFN